MEGLGLLSGFIRMGLGFRGLKVFGVQGFRV